MSDWIKGRIRAMEGRLGAMAEQDEKQCPDCDRTVDDDGDAVIQGCYYCAEQCETCGGGDCDQSC